MIVVQMLENVNPGVLGLLPHFLDEGNSQDARTQLDANYAHGGGWRPMGQWTMDAKHCIKYPGDPKLKPVAVVHLRDEAVFFYENAWVAIVSPRRELEVARMD